ncbi:3'(2'),5'-bisphosphate nucleotidase CysQ [Brevundimonas sp.]|uniref:3'(2'),5'-bisphosphate nucleotidase CysQ n=1 Tax=Brevundimonas sp. TaxID=1871086 RepID=UPI0025C002ED|nr:3'(2'),5'-bisphosphate nucleotidase CysQ [Brevundimonas sp.]
MLYRSGMLDRLNEDLASGALAEALAEIAEEAAQVILPYWRNGVAAATKADDSPVTQADHEAEALILARLSARWPDIPAVAEEAVAEHGAPDHPGEVFWLVDPLDGTRGFVQGRESFTVNIALVRGAAPAAGVVVAPATRTTWRSGPAGGGAFRRRFGEAWQAIRVRERPAEPVALLSHSMTDDEALRLATRHGCRSWQGTDSSLKFCLIAEGRFDAYPRTGPTSEWDTAAGQAVLEAAGGRVMAEDGGPLRYGKPGWRNGGFVALGG